MEAPPAPPVAGSLRGGAHRRRVLLGLLALVVLVAIALSLGVGARAIDPVTVLRALTAPLDGSRAVSTDDMVVLRLRIPRTAIGLAAGAAFGIAGTLVQAVTRNPLADPGLLGINAGASLAVVLAITLLGVSTPLGYVWFALGGAVVAVFIVFLVAGPRRGASPLTLTLAGAAVTAGLTSILTLLLLTRTQTLDQYRFWSVGSLTGRSVDVLALLAPFLVLGAVLALLLGRVLDALALGDELARGLGARVPLVRAVAVGAVVLLCGAATAAAGPIVFVGLAAPHLARRLVGMRHAELIPASALLGAALLVLADVGGRLVVPPGELEAGIVVAVLGAPLMIALVSRARRPVRPVVR
ncbi:MAG: iron ABC transporter permease [Micrococcales bacterium]|nr:iron ABC transporter permease [Micrococcales bacterium]